MARIYKLEVERGGVTAKLFVHDDGLLEIVDADTNSPADYLIQKLVMAKDMVVWMKKFGVNKYECKYVGS